MDNIFRLEDQDLKDKLSDEEFKYYFTLYKNGDIEARNKIIEHNLKLVESTLYKNYSLYYIEKDELFSVGYYGLIRAIEHFDIEKNYKFSSYATKCIINEINGFYSRQRNIKNLLSLDAEYINTDEGDKTNLYEVVPSDDKDLSIDFEDKDLINYLLESLSYVDRDIIEMYYGIGNHKKAYSQNEIAKKYCVTRQCISNRVVVSLKDLRHAAESEEFRHQKILRKNS